MNIKDELTLNYGFGLLELAEKNYQTAIIRLNNSWEESKAILGCQHEEYIKNLHSLAMAKYSQEKHDQKQQ